MVTIETEPIGNHQPSSLFQVVLSLTPKTSHSQNRGPAKCTSGATSRRVLPPGEYDRR